LTQPRTPNRPLMRPTTTGLSLLTTNTAVDYYSAALSSADASAAGSAASAAASGSAAAAGSAATGCGGLALLTGGAARLGASVSPCLLKCLTSLRTRSETCAPWPCQYSTRSTLILRGRSPPTAT